MTLALAYIYLAITCHLVVISDNEDRVQELILSTDKVLYNVTKINLLFLLSQSIIFYTIIKVGHFDLIQLTV